jgi:hypothetical protein
MGCSTILGVFPTLYLLDYGMDNATQRLEDIHSTTKEISLESFFVGPIHLTALLAGTLATITGPNVRAVLQVRVAQYCERIETNCNRQYQINAFPIECLPA